MKNWDSLEADINLIMNKNYSKGREGKIDKIVLHHNAANLTTRQCWQAWQNRQASAHYQVEADGKIGQLVWDSDTAWHAGNWQANTTSIGIEHANDHTADVWTISEATLDNGAHLVAALCKHYNLGRPVWGVNVFAHRDFKNTQCPGEIAASQNQAYMARAEYWYEQLTGQSPTPENPNTLKPVEEIAREVIAGKWGNGAERQEKLRAQGYDYETIQNLVNTLLSSPPSPSVDIDALARAVIAGQYGNGSERREKLGGLYEQVQARVNSLLG